MKRINFGFIFVVLGCLLFWTSLVRLALPADPAFVVFDELLFDGKPSTAELGLQPINVTYQELFAKAGPDKVPSRDVIATQLATRPNELVCFDIEHWPVNVRTRDKRGLASDKQPMVDALDKLIEVSRRTRAIRPDVRIGFYSMQPIREYWVAARPTQFPDELQPWLEANAFIRERLDPHVDYVAPSLYTFYPNEKEWLNYAAANVAEARKSGKPIYVFLWPEYHDEARPVELRYTPIPGKYWRKQLEFCRANVDGVVLWGGWKRQWNPQAEWWLETQSFVESLKQ